MDWPKVWLMFATYKRTETSLYCIDTIKKNLIYPNLHWHICDDGSGETDDGTRRWHVGVLAEAIGGDVTWHEMDTPPGEFNLGGCMNQGIYAALEHDVDFYLIVCDDDALNEPWDLRPAVDLLDTNPQFGGLRAAHLAEGLGVLVWSHQSKRLHRRYMWGRIVRDWTLNNTFGWIESYLYTFDTFLMHRRFFNAYGPIPDDLHPGETEVLMNLRYVRSDLGEDGPAVVVALGDAPGSPWAHVGEKAHWYKLLSEGRL